MARFAFRFQRLYRALGLPFGVTPRTCVVEVVDDYFSVRFGPWSLKTPVANIVACERAGPYSVLKTIGPPHLSLVDRGITFATNREAALCVHFAQPVPAIDPFGWIRHPGVTITVERLDDLERTLTDPGSTELDEVSEGVPAEAPRSLVVRCARWPFGMVLAVVRYSRMCGAVRRSHESRPGAPPHLPGPEGDEVQDLASGVGATFERTYRVRIAGARRSPEELLDLVASNFNRASPVEVAEFCERQPPGDESDVAAEYEVRMPGPWNGPVRTVEQTPTSIRLATLEGHMEAGQIEFRTSWDDSSPAAAGGRDLVFEIRSIARSGDRVFNALYDRLAVAREMQLYTWIHFCLRVGELAGGTVSGKPEVRTLRYTGDGEDLSEAPHRLAGGHSRV
jgi:hypothetical protein